MTLNFKEDNTDGIYRGEYSIELDSGVKLGNAIELDQNILGEKMAAELKEISLLRTLQSLIQKAISEKEKKQT